MPLLTMARTLPSAAGDYFPIGECTYYASYAFHAVTGLYPPWNGDAWQWGNNAAAMGYTVTSTPQVGSIVVLQPGIQGADSQLGHVAIVKSINGDGTFQADSMNWRGGSLVGYVQGYPITEQTFKPGMGVSFISGGPSSGAGAVPFSPGNSTAGGSTMLTSTTSVNQNELCGFGDIGCFIQKYALTPVEQAAVQIGVELLFLVIALVLIIVGIKVLTGYNAASAPLRAARKAMV